MNKSLIRIFILFFSLIGLTTAASTVDTYETYITDTDLQTAYPWTGAKVGDNTGIILNTTGGSDGDKALQMDFQFSSGQKDPWGYTGGYVGGGDTGLPVDWTGYDGVSFWVKASETGDIGQFVVFAVHEANSGDKYYSDTLYIKDLNSAKKSLLVFTSISCNRAIILNQRSCC